ncbi:carboxymuconolactone decarboxylase family protein [Lewinella sp. JB7]|uniref:cupin domain-containing carboxymuconolactone decarboxylase family protein n=1 Tax=Lewinella sp. JB7 TaxID=2962887 RepID=UPI0020CA18B0|nr:carboxymuconolactone decarboxylase family protein [Lewinella sp. JB7]MCP9235254.1 carboxymuconolactone decarboxylase family protein [Lewinella sp. JB7]
MFTRVFRILFMFCCLTVCAQPGRAQVTIPDSVNTVFPAGLRLESENFTGTVWVERLVTIENGEQAVAVGNVTFPPKSRSNWHTHPAGQTLVVLDGVGYYQQRGEPVRVLRKGQTVQCPPDVSHWHGAANDRWFVQMAMTSEHPQGRVQWGEAVTDAEYRAGIPVERAENDSMQNLAARYRHLATIASLAAQGKLEALQPALGDALDAGLTVNECREALTHLYAYAGFPRSIRSLRTLMATLEERRERGIDDPTGPDAGAIAEHQPKYARGKRVLEELIGRPLEGRSDYGDFAPAMDVFLKEHLFADLFERDVLSYRDREIVTISILASLGGVTPMLRGHLGIARNLGMTDAQLRNVLKIIGITAGAAAGEAALEVLENGASGG